MLSFARLEAGKLDVERVAVPVDDVLRSVEPLIAPPMRAQSVQFIHEPSDASLTALGDRERIIQISVNLLANAAKAAPGGVVRLSATAEGERVLIRVADNGVGIPADKLEAIFSPFTQLGRTLSAPRAGSGLGLSISRGLAEAMGG